MASEMSAPGVMQSASMRGNSFFDGVPADDAQPLSPPSAGTAAAHDSVFVDSPAAATASHRSGGAMEGVIEANGDVDGEDFAADHQGMDAMMLASVNELDLDEAGSRN